jgi:hypothetical protein
MTGRLATAKATRLAPALRPQTLSKGTDQSSHS